MDKTQDEIDLEQFVSLLDTALTSDNPAVQNALRNLLTIATLVTAEKPGDEVVRGPLRTLVETVKMLERRVAQLERPQYAPNQPYGPGYNPNQKWYTNPNTTGSPSGPTWYTPSYVVGDDPNYTGAWAFGGTNIDITNAIGDISLAHLDRDD